MIKWPDLGATLRALHAVFLTALILAVFPYTRESMIHIKLLLLQWFSVAAFFLLLIGTRLRREPLRAPAGFFGILTGFVLLQFVSVVVSSNHTYAFSNFIQLAALFLLYVVVSYAYRTPRQVWRLFSVVCFAMALASLYGFVQFLGLDPITWSKFARQGASTFGNPNLAAHALLPAILFACGLAAAKGSRWAFVFVGMFLLHLTIVQTRAAWLGLLLAGVLCAALLVARRRRCTPERAVLFGFSLTAVAAAAGLACILWFSYQRTGSPFPYDSSLASRYHSCYGACRMIDEKPVLGRGPGGYLLDNSPFWTDFEGTRYATRQILDNHVHNEPLEFAVDGGLVSGILYLSLLALGAATAARWAASREDAERARLGFVLAALFTGFAVDGLFGFNAHVPVSAAFLFTAFGILSGLSPRSEPAARAAARATPKLAWRVAVLVVVCVIPAGATRSFLSRYYEMRGYTAVKWHAPDEAVENYARAVELAPYDWYLYCAAATASMMLGKPEDAVTRLTKGIALNPHDPASLLAMAQAKFNLASGTENPAEKAALRGEVNEYVARAAAICPQLPEVDDLLGRSAVIEAWELARAASADTAPGQSQLLAAWQEAQSRLSAAIRPGAMDIGTLYHLLAEAQTGLGRFDEAEEAYARAIRINPDDQERWERFLSFAESHGRYQAFLDVIDWRLAQLGAAEVRNVEAYTKACLLKGAALEEGFTDHWGAVNLCRDAAMAQPLRYELWQQFYDLAQAPREKDLFRSALLTAVGALDAAASPLPPEFAAAAAIVRGGPNGIDEARGFLSESVKRHETGETAGAPAPELRWLADITIENARAAKLSPEQQGKELLAAGQFLCSIGEYAKGETTLAEALPHLGHQEQTLCTRLRAQALIELGEKQKAIDTLREALHSAPDDLSLLHALARTLAAAGNLDAARFQYQVVLGSPQLTQEARSLIEGEYRALGQPPPAASTR